jgi:hypothetical protein
MGMGEEIIKGVDADSEVAALLRKREKKEVIVLGWVESSMAPARRLRSSRSVELWGS